VDLLLNAYAWGIFSASQMGLSGRHAFVNRISTDVGMNAVGLATSPAAPSGSVLTSDTGELRWNTSVSGRGLLTINTPKTKALIGYADNLDTLLGGIKMRPGITRLGWCTLGLTLQKGEVMTNDCSMLLVATGWWENTGQVWKDATRNSVGNQWGTAPVLAEVVPFTVTLPIPTNHVQVWSLNERGQRKALLPVTGDSTTTVITVTTNEASCWYEVQVARWIASYGLWQQRYFSDLDLQDPGISGRTAAPLGDQVPNLIKYFMGLGPLATAPSAELPTPSVVNVNSQRFLGMTYQRDKLVNDVACIPEVSSNLVVWSGGPPHTTTHASSDLGSLERVTVRSTQAIGSSTAQYMRLRFQ
jgi:hypothetical protein